MKKQFIEASFIVEFIPVLFVLLFILYTKYMVEISHTVLGKLVAIILIVGYTTYDVLYGLVMCMMIILYYQLDCVETMKNIETYEQPKNITSEDNTNMSRDSDKQDANSFTGRDSDKQDANSFTIDKQDAIVLASTFENMTTYYDFQQKNCRNNQLFYNSKI